MASYASSPPCVHNEYKADFCKDKVSYAHSPPCTYTEYKADFQEYLLDGSSGASHQCGSANLENSGRNSQKLARHLNPNI